VRIVVFLGLATVAFSLFACGGGSRSTFIETGARPPAWSGRSVSDVEVFTATRPTQPFREAGIIESRQASQWSGGGNDVMLELRSAAAARGCDGVIVTGSADEVVSHTTTHRESSRTLAAGAGPPVIVPGEETTRTHLTTLKGYRAVCIVYTRQRSADPKKRAIAEAGITRKWLPTGHWQLGVNIATDRVSFEVRAIPAVDPGLLRVALHLKREIKSSTDRGKPEHEACDIVLLSDGQATTAANRTFHAAPARETIEGTLARSALEAALTAQSATIKVCETEIGLSAATSKRLTVFVEQLQSEATAAEPAAASGSRLEL
jgi:hypothetical protein